MHPFGGLVLWMLRLVFDAPGTVAGFRRWVLAVAPVAPGVRAMNNSPGQNEDHAEPVNLATPLEPPGEIEPPGRPVLPRVELAPGETKREALIRLYERCGETGDPRYGNRAKAAALAGEIAGRIGYHPGTARRELAKYLAAQTDGTPGSRPAAESDAEAVT